MRLNSSESTRLLSNVINPGIVNGIKRFCYYQTSALINSHLVLSEGSGVCSRHQGCNVDKANPHHPRFLITASSVASWERGTHATICEHAKLGVLASSKRAMRLLAVSILVDYIGCQERRTVRSSTYPVLRPCPSSLCPKNTKSVLSSFMPVTNPLYTQSLA